MSEKMLVTQALDERDLLVKKISDKIDKASFVDTIKPNEDKVYLSIPAPIEPPDRSLRATIPAAQSHYSGGGNHHSGN